ncbi:enoyl-CoA hydratase/isomerase family protein [Mycolicibacterium confluentis]|uniref:Putative enoyl-CoA hydratase/isomerase n=1 Tax=Mycolicibacterium confluentis TaxID=28047 RepID=A0A7I7Y288_9MYCO|nr:enoyl-CoA hydratase-related protein [Mycolicibacterium confluentis]MCV7320711.1 enoyl-CoA hydratase/isomerase family protein [Mycolicibacterium confluentis]ORV30350.1 enoyl-CoA hydratase [Mycolicibacterium confluentis]BBZ35758.1 putative enoyl-CoA hydratase/isomerase [Mycolicibacterium confluentis]
MNRTGAATVGHTLHAGVATVTLDRPAASNALDCAMKNGLLQVLSELQAENDARAVVITATGRNFCVGQDLAEHVEALRADPAHAMDTVREHYNPVMTALAALEVPVVVAINGACVGAGLGLALAADIRIAGSGARFATAFTGIGLAADSALSASLPRAIGASRATAMFLLGDTIDAGTAQEWGLVHQVVDDDSVVDVATSVASRLANGPTAAFQSVKALLRDNAAAPLRDVLEREAQAQQRLGGSVDHSAAVAAFLAKAKPVFVGH